MTASTSTGSIDLSRRDLTLDLARVVCVLLVVLIHLLMTGVGRDTTGAIIVNRPLEETPWFAPATWVGQIMPLFFVVGGFATLTAWRSAERRGEADAAYVRGRVLRLAQPALPLFAMYGIVLGVAALVGVAADLVAAAAIGAGSPLWFLAAYIICQAATPLTVRLHRRAPLATVLVMLAGVLAVDGLRALTGATAVGLLNLLFVWPLCQQLGYGYAEGWWDRPRRQLALIAVGAYAALAPLTLVGDYDPDMLFNLNPPTLPLVLLAIGQTAMLRLLHPVLSALMRRREARTVVFVLGSRLMTIYLWHLPITIVLCGVALLVPGAAPEPGSASWWATRPVMLVLVLAALLAVSLLTQRWEAPRLVGAVPPTGWVAVATVCAVVPPFLVMQWGLDVRLALVGVALLTPAVLILGRWPAGRRVA